MANRTVFNASQRLKERQNKVASAVSDANNKIAPKAATTGSNSAGKKKNKQFQADKKRLNNMSRAQIEALRAKLRKKKVVSNKITPIQD